MTIAEDIAALHVRMVRAEDACHEAEAEYWRFEITALEHARDDEARRLHLRQLSKDYARLCHCGQVDAAAVVKAEIDRLDRQP